MLDPAGLRKVLGDLGITLTENGALEPDRDRSGAGRAFVEAQNDVGDFGFQVRLRLPVA